MCVELAAAMNRAMPASDMGVSENRGPGYGILNSRTLIIRTPRQGTPNFRKL